MANAKSSERTLYEGMFLYPQSFGPNLGAAADEVKSILERAGAELVLLTKWDERRLAYEIQGQKRGVYLLAYFYCPGVGISSIERDCNLSENVLRAMCLKADHMGETELEAAKEEFTDIAVEVATRGEQGEAGEQTEAVKEQEAEVASEATDAEGETPSDTTEAVAADA